MKDVVVVVLCGVGFAFALSGVVGILRMPDLYTRIQCASKTITMGALPLLAAIAVAEGPLTGYGGRALFVAVLLLVFNPATSHSLARAAYKTGVPMWHGSVVDEPRQGEDRAGDGDET